MKPQDDRRRTKFGAVTRQKIRTWFLPATVAAAVVVVGLAGYLALAHSPDPSPTPTNQADDAVPSLTEAASPGGQSAKSGPGSEPADGVLGSDMAWSGVLGLVGAAASEGMPTGPVAGAVDGVDGSVGQAADGSVGDGVDGSAGPVLPDPGVTPAPDGADTSANTPPDSQAGTPPTTPQAEAAAAATAPVDCSVAKCVALTFDDGPDRHTDKILDVLAAKGVKATFFVQGYRVALFPDQLKREAAEGHEIANHTWSHKNLTQLTPRAIKLQIKKTNAAVEEATGVTPKFVRPPYGAVSAKVEKYAGLPLVMWSVDTRDWETKKVKKIIRHIKKDTQPGAIVLMHDTLAATGKALGRSIDILRKQGYTFVTVSELLGPNVKPGHIYRER